jgi:hypothetical protein
MASAPWARSLMWLMQLRESIGSVSLSHPESCPCDVCKAAQGDEDAFVRVLASWGSDG